MRDNCGMRWGENERNKYIVLPFWRNDTWQPFSYVLILSINNEINSFVIATMQANQTIMYPPPMPAPAAPSFIEGYSSEKRKQLTLHRYMSDCFARDPATRQFGMVFLGTLALLTIGVGLGIGLGNISHARSFVCLITVENLVESHDSI